jgi:hypothetical protein
MVKRNAISPATPRALYEIRTDPAKLYETFGPFAEEGVRQRTAQELDHSRRNPGFQLRDQGLCSHPSN